MASRWFLNRLDVQADSIPEAVDHAMEHRRCTVVLLDDEGTPTTFLASVAAILEQSMYSRDRPFDAAISGEFVVLGERDSSYEGGRIHSSVLRPQEHPVTASRSHLPILPPCLASLTVPPVLRHSRIPQLIYSFPALSEIKSLLYRCWLIRSGRSNEPAHDELSQFYQHVYSDPQFDPGFVSSAIHMPIPVALSSLLGRTFQFKGLGDDVRSDVLWVISQLVQVVELYGWLIQSLVLKLPSDALLNGAEFVIASNPAKNHNIRRQWLIDRAVADADFVYHSMSTVELIPAVKRAITVATSAPFQRLTDKWIQQRAKRNVAVESPLPVIVSTVNKTRQHLKCGFVQIKQLLGTLMHECYAKSLELREGPCFEPLFRANSTVSATLRLHLVASAAESIFIRIQQFSYRSKMLADKSPLAAQLERIVALMEDAGTTLVTRTVQTELGLQGDRSDLWGLISDVFEKVSAAYQTLVQKLNVSLSAMEITAEEAVGVMLQQDSNVKENGEQPWQSLMGALAHQMFGDSEFQSMCRLLISAKTESQEDFQVLQAAADSFRCEISVLGEEQMRVSPCEGFIHRSLFLRRSSVDACLFQSAIDHVEVTGSFKRLRPNSNLKTSVVLTTLANACIEALHKIPEDRHIGSHLSSVVLQQTISHLIACQTLPVSLSRYLTPSLQSLSLANSTKVLDDTLRSVASVCPSLKHLDVSGCPRLTSSGFIDFVSVVGSNLKSVNISSTGVQDDGVRALSTHCFGLTSLFVDHLYVTNETMQIVIASCPLQVLSAAFLKGNQLTDTALIFSTPMVCLDIRGCSRISNRSLPKLGGSQLDALSLGAYASPISDLSALPSVPNLRQLRLQDLSGGTEASFVNFFGRIPRLEALQLLRCPFATNPALLQLAQCPLKRLEITMTTIENETLCRLASELLSELVLTRCENIDDEGLIRLVRDAPNLRSIKLSNLPSVSDVGVSALPSCEKLSVCSLNFIPELTDAALHSLSSLRITEFQVTGCDVTSVGICAAISAFKQLRVLDFSHCRLVDDAALSACAHNKMLEVLVVSYCKKLTYPPLSSVLRSVSLLRELRVDGIATIGRFPIVHPGIHSIGLSGCRLGDSLVVTTAGCPRLVNLDVSHSHIDGDSLERAVAQNSNIFRLNVRGCQLSQLQLKYLQLNGRIVFK